LLNESSAVTVKLNGVPVLAVEVAGETESLDAGAEPIGMELEVPVSKSVPVTVTVWGPAVFNVTDPVPVPFVIVELAGSTAWASELVKCTVPEYVATALLLASSAVTVMLKAVPAAGEGMVDVTEKWLATCWGVVVVEPHPFISRRPQIESKTIRAFFITSSQVYVRFVKARFTPHG
jgi:hypothetical protein